MFSYLPTPDELEPEIAIEDGWLIVRLQSGEVIRTPFFPDESFCSEEEMDRKIRAGRVRARFRPRVLLAGRSDDALPLLRAELAAAVRAARLKRGERRLLRLFLTGLDQREIAEAAGVAQSSVSRAFSRICRKIRDARAGEPLSGVYEAYLESTGRRPPATFPGIRDLGPKWERESCTVEFDSGPVRILLEVRTRPGEIFRACYQVRERGRWVTRGSMDTGYSTARLALAHARGLLAIAPHIMLDDGKERTFKRMVR